MFYQNGSLPKQVNKACCIIDLLYLLFKGGHTPAADAKHVKKAIPKGFGFGIFAAFVFPFFTKGKALLFISFQLSGINDQDVCFGTFTM
jgi:hypothetical protein